MVWQEVVDLPNKTLQGYLVMLWLVTREKKLHPPPSFVASSARFCDMMRGPLQDGRRQFFGAGALLQEVQV